MRIIDWSSDVCSSDLSFFQGVIANRLSSQIHRLAGAERVLSYSSHEANLSKRQGKMALRPVLVCSDARGHRSGFAGKRRRCISIQPLAPDRMSLARLSTACGGGDGLKVMSLYPKTLSRKIERASCRESGCPYV